MDNSMKRNGYLVDSVLDTEKGVCYLCGKVGDTAIHEIFYGTGLRKASKEHGTWVNICPNCHQIAPYSVHSNQNDGLDLKLKKDAQKQFESLYGHDEFMRIFGKNYL